MRFSIEIFRECYVTAIPDVIPKESTTVRRSRIMVCTSSKIIASLVLSLCVFPTGCDSNKPQAKIPQKPMSVLPEADRDPESVTTSFTEAEALVFGQAWEEAASEGDLDALEQLYDWGGMLQRAIDGLGLNAEAANGFKMGATTKSMVGKIGGPIAEVLKQGGSYRLIRIVSRGGEMHAVFRLLQADLGINYHDLRLARRGNSQRIQGDRFFVAMTGEEMADSLRNIVGPAIQSQGSMTSKRTGEPNQDFKALETQSKMMQAARAKDTQEVKRLTATLPEKYRETKMVLLATIMAADVEDETNYLAILDQYVKKFPNDPSVGLVTLDAAVIRKDSVLLEKSRQQVQDWVGGDPYLDLLVGANFAEMGRLDDAIKLTESIDVASLNLSEAHNMKLTMTLAANDHASTLKSLLALRDDFGLELNDLSLDEQFKEFVASPEFELLSKK